VGWGGGLKVQNCQVEHVLMTLLKQLSADGYIQSRMECSTEDESVAGRGQNRRRLDLPDCR
jgi:hypothetical protein